MNPSSHCGDRAGTILPATESFTPQTWLYADSPALYCYVSPLPRPMRLFTFIAFVLRPRLSRSTPPLRLRLILLWLRLCLGRGRSFLRLSQAPVRNGEKQDRKIRTSESAREPSLQCARCWKAHSVDGVMERSPRAISLSQRYVMRTQTRCFSHTLVANQTCDKSN